MPLVGGEKERSIQSALDARDYRYSERLFASRSGFCQPQSIRGSNLLVSAPYRQTRFRV